MRYDQLFSHLATAVVVVFWGTVAAIIVAFCVSVLA